MKTLATTLLLLLVVAPLTEGAPRLAKAFREDRAGWVYVHLEGTPQEIGYQHGYLLTPEIDDALRMFKLFVKRSSGKDWAFYRAAAERMFWPKLDREYQEEIAGIAEGLRARGKQYDQTDITALNGWMELAWYYIPAFDERVKKAKNQGAGDHCSALIATGSYTADGMIVMAHNAWVDYIVGERWNIILDIVPQKGNRILMDSFPGFIHSGDDFVETSAGILYTETTIGGFKGYDEKGVPEFQRARKAAQYARSIDDFVRIMKQGNNGGYANSWLVGDIKINEIARLDLGLRNVGLARTNDGILYGSNFPSDDKLTAEETSYDPTDMAATNTARKLRWEQIGEAAKGKIDAEYAKRFLGDHFDETNLLPGACLRTLCGHGERDAHGIPEFGWGPYYPVGAVQGKVTTAALAKELKLWARMGHPCGEDFLTAPFFMQHPQYRWQAPFLHDMKGHPWALFTVQKS
jgi:hypothetical protein